MRAYPRLLLVALLAAGIAGCGKGAHQGIAPQLGLKGSAAKAAEGLGFPVIATKNTTRVGGADATADAAAISRAVFPGGSGAQRPPAVTLVDANGWQAGIAASALMARPIHAPILLSDGTTLPRASSDALAALKPRGSAAAGGAQVIRVGDVARPSGLRSTDIRASNPFAMARAIDAFNAAARGQTSDHVLVVSADDPAFAMPAAAWAAKSGDPVLFTKRNTLPPDTRAAIAAHQQPKIYVLGPSRVIAPSVTRALRRLGRVTRVGGDDPVTNAIAFARFLDGTFGWGVVDPGHGLVFASAGGDPQVASAAAPLSGTGTYGPLLLVGSAHDLDHPLLTYLLDIQPGFSKDPVRGVYNHGWLVGDDDSLSVAEQSQIDRLLEISPVSAPKTP